MERRHAQIQIALLYIGLQLGSSIWIAQNDRVFCIGAIGFAKLKGLFKIWATCNKFNLYDAQRAAAILM